MEQQSIKMLSKKVSCVNTPKFIVLLYQMEDSRHVSTTVTPNAMPGMDKTFTPMETEGSKLSQGRGSQNH